MSGDGHGRSSTQGEGFAGFAPLRALTDVQQLAVETATRSFREFARVFQPAPAEPSSRVDAESTASADEWTSSMSELRRSITKSFDMYLEIAERFFNASTRSIEDVLRGRGATITGSRRGGSSAPLRLSGRAGEEASAPIWLHNLDETPTASLRYTTTALVNMHGAAIPPTAITVVPEHGDAVDGGTSASATLTIHIGPDIAPGTYVGHVLVAPVDDAILPVWLVVRAAEVPVDGSN